MYTDENENRTLKEYRSSEVELHIELMKICRKYMNELGIISIMGILDLVKQEIIELEKATRHGMKDAEFEESEDEVKTDVEPSNENLFK